MRDNKLTEQDGHDRQAAWPEECGTRTSPFIAIMERTGTT